MEIKENTLQGGGSWDDPPPSVEKIQALNGIVENLSHWDNEANVHI